MRGEENGRKGKGGKRKEEWMYHHKRETGKKKNGENKIERGRS
jgi:hypothetical protein